MITKDNLEAVLKALKYVKDMRRKIYVKEYPVFDCSIKVDFTTQKIFYPEDKGMVIHRKTTCNFSEPENFVVLECITSLLDKGYKPRHIELEKPMPGGHDDTGGYCDIQVKDNDDKTFLLIECKRADEFEKYWKKTLVDGDQLFRYYNSYRQAQALCLYMSDFSGGGLKRSTNIISMVDNEEYLETNKKLRSFKDVRDENGDKHDYFSVWKNTYQQDFSTVGIFEEDIDVYTVGKSKYTVKDLIEVDHETIQKKYHEFATILRQHNVGSHENAFDKLINLFLAKIVDETINSSELQFYWKGAAFDDYYSLQDRLQLLYKEGMERFLGEEVTYIDQKQVREAFHLFKSDPDATREKVLDYFRQLKFYTNSDFAFLDVHNEELFYHNAEILKKIVKMLEDIKLKTEERNQFLGDLFEGFLDDGVKQSEGQFFTPLPIAKFLVSSLPIEKIVNSGKIPRVIDYACGAGHFLTEYAAYVKKIVELDSTKNVEEYYKEIYGVEKEYRLSKVAKVAAFMYGEPDIQIIYGDALEKNLRIDSEKYDVLIANPPYSVKGFLETISEESRNRFQLSKEVSDISKNNSIEVFFVERAKQLLAEKGIAAIILPVSVLTNQNIYISCREILLKNFDFIAISEFGTHTFGKTGTNTVALFIRRKEENPNIAVHFKNRIDAWFNSDNSKDEVFKDESFIEAYCQHCEINYDEYIIWLMGGDNPNAQIFESYVRKAKSAKRYKDILSKKITTKYSEKDREVEGNKWVDDFCRVIEKEKLFYFMLALSNPCPVVVSKCPTDKTEEKATKKEKLFLGYEWSGAKGSEGIKYLNSKSVSDDDWISKNDGINSIVTPLFNPKNYADSEKINDLIRKNFSSEEIVIPDSLSEYVKVYRLVDMLDFSKTEFDKVLKTSGIESRIGQKLYKYSTDSLANILGKVDGNTTKIEASEIQAEGKIPVVTQEQGRLITGYCDSKKPISDLPLIVFGDHSCTLKYVDFKFVRGADGTQLIKSNGKCILKYLFYFLSHQRIYNSEKYERHFKYLKDIQIPIPAQGIQTTIIEECEKIDDRTEKERKKIAKYAEKQKALVEALKGKREKLCVVAPYVSDRVDLSTIELSSYITTDNMLKNYEGWIPITEKPNIDKVVEYKKDDILVSNIRPYLKKICYMEKAGGCSPDVLVFRVKDKKHIIPKYLFYQMRVNAFFDNAMSDVKGMKMPRGKKDTVASYEIVIIPYDMQKEFVRKMDVLQKKILESQVVIDKADNDIEMILKNYLE